MGFLRKAGAVHRGFIPTRCHWNCLKCLEQTTPNSPGFELSYKHETWTRSLSSSALAHEWSLWLGMDLGKMQVKLVKFNIVCGGFVLLWETQMEPKKMPGHSHQLAGRSSKKKQVPEENVLHLLLGQYRPGAGMATPWSLAGVWVVI